jgi:hypothetical protein
VGMMYGYNKVIEVIEGEKCMEVFSREELKGRNENFN